MVINMDLKMLLTPEGANYLRDWAEAMSITIKNIIVDTEKVVSVYKFVSEDVGSHREAFYQMLLHLKKAQENSTEAISCLGVELKKTADKIDIYYNSTSDGTQTPATKKLTLHI